MGLLPGVAHHADALLSPDEPEEWLPDVRSVLPHEYVLPSGLPPISRIAQDARTYAKRMYREQVRANDLAEAMAEEMPAMSVPEHLSQRDSAEHTATPHSTNLKHQAGSSVVAVQPYELLRAIEKKDLQLIFHVRDSQFSLLVQQREGVTPLLYAMRLGPKYRDVAILLTGALSRYVNNLPDAPSKSTRETLRQVRANLKLAITASLEASQTDLVSSYLQVLVMSEGERWILEKAHIVALAIRSGPSSVPVNTAKQSVMHFATAELKQLRKEYLIASVEDYVSNAAIDLLLMGAWELAQEYTKLPSKDTLPTYQFGRDDRMFQSFRDRIASVSNQNAYTKIPRNIRQSISTLIAIAGKHTISFGQKIENLRQDLDI